MNVPDLSDAFTQRDAIEEASYLMNLAIKELADTKIWTDIMQLSTDLDLFSVDQDYHLSLWYVIQLGQWNKILVPLPTVLGIYNFACGGSFHDGFLCCRALSLSQGKDFDIFGLIIYTVEKNI